MSTAIEPRLAAGAEELGVLLCCAVRIEPTLLRTARLELAPRYDVGAEADLWFSDWIASRSADYIVLRADVVTGLRDRLAERLAPNAEPDLADRIWTVMSRVHAGLSAALLLEEKLGLTAVRVIAGTAAPAEIERVLHPALRAVVDERRMGVAEWFTGALERLPELVRHSTAGWQLAQPSDNRPTLKGAAATPIDMSAVYTLGDLVSDTTLTVRHDGNHLHLNEPAAPGGEIIPIPDTFPRVVQIRWTAEETPRQETLLIDPQHSASVAVDTGPVRLQTGRGLIFEISPNRIARPAPGRRRALLIGAPFGGLTGVENDLAAMERALLRRGFHTSRMDGMRATRAGIITAYEQLIAETEPGDTAVVFYSGQGGRVEAPADIGRDKTPVQFIVPVDFLDTTDDDFRGILSIELSILLGRLTDRTHNVTVMFDCCHAGQMSHAPDLSSKNLPSDSVEFQHSSHRAIGRVRPETVRVHLDRVLRQAPAVQRRLMQRRHLAVHLAACAPEQSAYEYHGASGARIGVFTESLTMALAEAEGIEVTWAALMEQVRTRVLGITSGQRPEVVGPSRRLLFSVDEAKPNGALPAVMDRDGRIRVPGAGLLGTRLGDSLTIMPAGADSPDPATRISTATIDQVDLESASATLDTSKLLRLPIGAQAFRTATAEAAVPVSMPRTDPRTADLVHCLEASTSVRLAGPTDDPIAEIVVDDDGLGIRDRFGSLHPPRPADPAGSARIASDLDQLARAAKLRGLVTEPQWTFHPSTEIEWGLVTSGGLVPLPLVGATVAAGERIYVNVHNGSMNAVYVTLLEIGVAGAISVINMSAPSGVRVGPGGGYRFGHEPLFDTWTGIPVTWPAGLPREKDRPQTVIVVIFSQPTDVSVLVQDGVRAGTARAQVPDLFARDLDLAVRERPEHRYAVSKIEFVVRISS